MTETDTLPTPEQPEPAVVLDELPDSLDDDARLPRFRHEVFARVYMASGLDIEKAREAAGVTKQTAQAILKRVDVQRRLATLLDAQVASSQLDAAATLAATASIAFADVSDVIDVDDFGSVRLRNLKQLEKRLTYPIRKIKQTESHDGTIRTEVELEARVPALRLLNQHGTDLASLARLQGDLPEPPPPAEDNKKMEALPLLEHDVEVATIMARTGIPQILDAEVSPPNGDRH